MVIRPASEAWVDDDDSGGEMRTRGEEYGYLTRERKIRRSLNNMMIVLFDPKK